MSLGGRKAGKAHVALAAAVLCALGALANPPASAAPTAARGGPPPAAVPLSDDIRQAAQWIVESADNAGRPFAVVDKKAAQLVVFDAGGQVLGAAPALLGLASGDEAVPGLGERDPADIAPAERTTPAGRFVSEPGLNLDGEDVVWFDYDAGLAIHRLRPGSAQERREQRLASASPDDNRVSLGCVVVTPAFFESVVRPALGRRHGAVYVLPETRPLHELFGGLQMVMRRP